MHLVVIPLARVLVALLFVDLKQLLLASFVTWVFVIVKLTNTLANFGDSSSILAKILANWKFFASFFESLYPPPRKPSSHVLLDLQDFKHLIQAEHFLLGFDW